MGLVWLGDLMARTFDAASNEYLYNDSFTGISGVPFSMACWLYFTDATNDRPGIWIGDKDVINHRSQLQFQDSGAVFNFQYETASGTSESSGGSMSVNTWYHLAGVAASVSSRIGYLDGAAQTEDTNNWGDLTAVDRVAIGAEAGSTPVEYMDGHVAEAAVWDVALSQADITTLAAGYSPLFVKPQNLVFYLPMVRDEDLDWIANLSMTAAATPTVSDHPPKIIYPLFSTTLTIPSALAALSIDLRDDNDSALAQGVRIYGP
jgi:hypothetical protein